MSDANVIAPRQFLWITARVRNTNAPFSYGFWSGAGNISADIINPENGRQETRNWEGAGTLIDMDSVPERMGIEATSFGIRASQIAPSVQNIVRNYNLKQARVELYLARFDPDTRLPLEPGLVQFIGQVDTAVINTPAENDYGSIELTVYSDAQELSRTFTDTRSNDSQLRRLANDNFYADTTSVSGWEMAWGGTKASIKTTGPKRYDISSNQNV